MLPLSINLLCQGSDNPIIHYLDLPYPSIHPGEPFITVILSPLTIYIHVSNLKFTQIRQTLTSRWTFKDHLGCHIPTCENYFWGKWATIGHSSAMHSQLNQLQMVVSRSLWWHNVFIQIFAHAQIDVHPPSSSSSRNTKIGEFDDFCIKNAWIWGQDDGPIIMQVLHVLLTLSALLLEWIRYLPKWGYKMVLNAQWSL